MEELRLGDKNSGKGTNMTKCKKLVKTTLVRCRSARVCPERLKRSIAVSIYGLPQKSNIPCGDLGDCSELGNGAFCCQNT